MPKRFATSFDTFKGIGKGLFSVLAFPLCVVATGALYVGYQSAQSVNIIAAYFVGKDSWIGRQLKWDPNFDKFAQGCKDAYEWMFDLTVSTAKNFAGMASNVSRSVISEHTHLLTGFDSKAELTDKDKRSENINREPNIGADTPSGSPEPKSCLQFLAKAIGLSK